jgi:hypothetical protein
MYDIAVSMIVMNGLLVGRGRPTRCSTGLTRREWVLRLRVIASQYSMQSGVDLSLSAVSIEVRWIYTGLHAISGFELVGRIIRYYFNLYFIEDIAEKSIPYNLDSSVHISLLI